MRVKINVTTPFSLIPTTAFLLLSVYRNKIKATATIQISHYNQNVFSNTKKTFLHHSSFNFLFRKLTTYFPGEFLYLEQWCLKRKCCGQTFPSIVRPARYYHRPTWFRVLERRMKSRSWCDCNFCFRKEHRFSPHIFIVFFSTKCMV